MKKSSLFKIYQKQKSIQQNKNEKLQLSVQVYNCRKHQSVFIIKEKGVGKSCLLLQYVEQKFRDSHQVTMGVEFGTNILKIDKHVIKLHIWDTAGQESFSSMIRAYYRNSIGCILVFDLTERKTFDAIIKWHSEVINCTGNDIQIIIVGNKSDLEEKRQVSEDEAITLAQQLNAMYIETSAFNGKHVIEIFEKLTQKILDEIKLGVLDPQDQIYGIKLGDFEKKKLSEIQSIRKQSVQITYPIPNHQQQCC